MPVIRVEMFSGRSREQKRALAKALTEAYLGVLGGKPQGIHVILQEVEKEDWGVGGELCADLYPDPPSTETGGNGKRA